MDTSKLNLRCPDCCCEQFKLPAELNPEDEITCPGCGLVDNLKSLQVPVADSLDEQIAETVRKASRQNPE